MFKVADHQMPAIVSDSSGTDNQIEAVLGSELDNEMLEHFNQIQPIILFTQKNRKMYYNNHFGFLIGWILLSCVLVIIIIYSYMIYSHIGFTDGLEIAVYTIDLVLCATCIAVIPCTALQMSKLTFKDEGLIKARNLRDGRDHKIKRTINVDKILLYQTFVGLLTFQILSMISAVDRGDYLIFSASVAQLVFGFIQTLFLNWFACNKRATKILHYYKKPGRQGLEVLRTANLALWLVNTFLLEQLETKQLNWEAFGQEGWTILSTLFQPLTILFHFHSMLCYAEVIARSYSSKYIGLQRTDKEEHESSNLED